MDKISIIIPVYNVEPYIRKCLDSVINQTYTNLEIICIDDGSTDNSGKICDEYAKQDNRIKVFHKANGGLSSALNMGLKKFTGEYLGFVDSDDWIEPDMFEVLHKTLRHNNVSFSAVSFYMDYEDCSCYAVAAREEIPNRVLTQKEMLLFAFRWFQYGGFGFSVQNKLFSANIIEKLVFDENIKVAMDAKFTVNVILTDKCTGFFLCKPYYHYYQRTSSLINSKLITNELDRIKALKEIVAKSDEKGFNDITKWLKRDICYYASLLAEEALKNGDNDLFDLMRNEMKNYLNEYIETNSEYPERIERIRKLMNFEQENNNG